MRNMMTPPEMWQPRELGDPFLMRYDGTYYLYCSSAGSGRGVKCWTCADMARYQYAGTVCSDERVDGAYAPEVLYLYGKFWMVTSPVGSGHYLLRADSPLGPFEVISDNLGLLIDGSLFCDDDGREYFLRAGHTGIQIHDMPSPDRISPNGRVIAESYMGHWTEGPMIVKRDGRYFLTYTGNHCLSRGYAVDYSVSRIAPDRGYRNMSNRTLLLETDEPFYALGHSSTCLAPDLSALYIVYHNNEFDANGRPLGRRLNVDRLFFNGDRMYTNATYWAQRDPAMPVFSCRGGLDSAPQTPERFAAECNFTFSGRVRVRAGGAALMLSHTGAWELSADGEAIARGALPACVAMDALVCARLTYDGQTLRAYVNGLQLAYIDCRVSPGAFAVDGADALGFAALSSPEDDRAWEKPVPGTFDAIHAVNARDFEAVETERGCLGASMRAGDTLKFCVNAREAGRYHIALRVMENGAPTWRRHGVAALVAGAGVCEITLEAAAVVDRVALTPYAQVTPITLIENGESTGALKVLGHKRDKSMIRKYSGFTDAENDGEAYYGEVGYADYKVVADCHFDPESANAELSVLLRVSRESWHPAQVRHARRGYRVCLSQGTVTLYRDDYGEETVAAARVRIPDDCRVTLVCEARDQTIFVAINGAPALVWRDPEAFLYGKIGISCAGEGAGFLSLRIAREGPAA